MFGGVALFGAGTLALGESTIQPLSLAALVLMGAGDMVSAYVRHLLMQLEALTIFVAGSAQSIRSSSAPLINWEIRIRRHRWLGWPGAGRAAVRRADAGCHGRVDVALADAVYHGPLSQGGDSFCRQALTTPSYAVGAYTSAKLSL